MRAGIPEAKQHLLAAQLPSAATTNFFRPSGQPHSESIRTLESEDTKDPKKAAYSKHFHDQLTLLAELKTSLTEAKQILSTPAISTTFAAVSATDTDQKHPPSTPSITPAPLPSISTAIAIADADKKAVSAVSAIELNSDGKDDVKEFNSKKTVETKVDIAYAKGCAEVRGRRFVDACLLWEKFAAKLNTNQKTEQKKVAKKEEPETALSIYFKWLAENSKWMAEFTAIQNDATALRKAAIEYHRSRLQKEVDQNIEGATEKLKKFNDAAESISPDEAEEGVISNYAEKVKDAMKSLYKDLQKHLNHKYKADFKEGVDLDLGDLEAVLTTFELSQKHTSIVNKIVFNPVLKPISVQINNAGTDEKKRDKEEAKSIPVQKPVELQLTTIPLNRLTDDQIDEYLIKIFAKDEKNQPLWFRKLALGIQRFFKEKLKPIQEEAIATIKAAEAAIATAKAARKQAISKGDTAQIRAYTETIATEKAKIQQARQTRRTKVCELLGHPPANWRRGPGLSNFYITRMEFKYTATEDGKHDQPDSKGPGTSSSIISKQKNILAREFSRSSFPGPDFVIVSGKENGERIRLVKNNLKQLLEARLPQIVKDFCARFTPDAKDGALQEPLPIAVLIQSLLSPIGLDNDLLDATARNNNSSMVRVLREAMLQLQNEYGNEVVVEGKRCRFNFITQNQAINKLRNGGVEVRRIDPALAFNKGESLQLLRAVTDVLPLMRKKLSDENKKICDEFIALLTGILNEPNRMNLQISDVKTRTAKFLNKINKIFINNDEDREFSLLVQAVSQYAPLIYSTIPDDVKNGLNKQLHMANLGEIIATTIGGLAHGFCKSGNDRASFKEGRKAAMLGHFAHHGTLPQYNNAVPWHVFVTTIDNNDEVCICQSVPPKTDTAMLSEHADFIRDFVHPVINSGHMDQIREEGAKGSAMCKEKAGIIDPLYIKNHCSKTQLKVEKVISGFTKPQEKAKSAITIADEYVFEDTGAAIADQRKNQRAQKGYTDKPSAYFISMGNWSNAGIPEKIKTFLAANNLDEEWADILGFNRQTPSHATFSQWLTCGGELFQFGKQLAEKAGLTRAELAEYQQHTQRVEAVIAEAANGQIFNPKRPFIPRLFFKELRKLYNLANLPPAESSSKTKTDSKYSEDDRREAPSSKHSARYNLEDTLRSERMILSTTLANLTATYGAVYEEKRNGHALRQEAKELSGIVPNTGSYIPFWRGGVLRKWGTPSPELEPILILLAIIIERYQTKRLNDTHNELLFELFADFYAATATFTTDSDSKEASAVKEKRKEIIDCCLKIILEKTCLNDVERNNPDVTSHRDNLLRFHTEISAKKKQWGWYWFRTKVRDYRVTFPAITLGLSDIAVYLFKGLAITFGLVKDNSSTADDLQLMDRILFGAFGAFAIWAIGGGIYDRRQLKRLQHNAEERAIQLMGPGALTEPEKPKDQAEQAAGRQNIVLDTISVVPTTPTLNL